MGVCVCVWVCGCECVVDPLRGALWRGDSEMISVVEMYVAGSVCIVEGGGKRGGELRRSGREGFE